jgi:hypothetical protein
MPPKDNWLSGLTPSERSQRAAHAVNTFWSQCTDEERAARTKHMRANSPSELAYHARKLGFDPNNMSESEVKRAKSARKAYYAGLVYRSSRARRKRKEEREAAARKAAATDGGDAA